MDQDPALEVLKQAILLERQGKAFYEQVSRQSQAQPVTELFKTMAEEETRHIDVLSRQFSGYADSGRFDQAEMEASSAGISSEILTRDIRAQISAAGYEAAAISAAMDMENRAVRVYSERAQAATDPNERRLYSWLADWERGHLKLLVDINDALIEDIWHENNFWPF